MTALRRVFNPFDWHLRHYKAAAAASGGNGDVAGAGLPAQSLASRSKSHIYGSTSGAAAGSGGDEVRLRGSCMQHTLGGRRVHTTGHAAHVRCEVWKVVL